MMGAHNRSRALRRLRQIQTWIDDQNRTAAERESARNVLAQLQQTYRISADEINNIRGPMHKAYRIMVTVRSEDHLKLARACAMLMDSMIFYFKREGKVEFVGDISAATRSKWLFKYLDEQIEEAFAKDSKRWQIFSCWVSNPPIFYLSIIEVLVGRMHYFFSQKMKRAQTLRSDCTALTIYQPDAVSVDMLEIRDQMQKRSEEERVRETALEDAGLLAEEESEPPQAVFRDPEAQRMGHNIHIPLNVTIEGVVVPTSKKQLEKRQKTGMARTWMNNSSKDLLGRLLFSIRG